MIEILEELILKYDRIFIFLISSGLLGFYLIWNMAKEEFDKKDIIIIDGKDMGLGNKIIVDMILEMALKNKFFDEIINVINVKK